MPRDTVEELELTSYRSIEARVLPEAKPVETDAVTEALIKARAVISREEAWCGHGPGDQVVTFCAAMAIRRVCGVSTNGIGRSDWYDIGFRLWDEAMNALSLALPRGGRNGGIVIVADYNDHPDTTHADMMALFDRAIARRSEIGA